MIPYREFFGDCANVEDHKMLQIIADLCLENEVFSRMFNYQEYVTFDTTTMKNVLVQELSSQRFQVFLDYFKNSYIYQLYKSMKDPMKSKEAREVGNQLLKTNNHDAKIHREIWTNYTKSIALAPLNSEELAVAYGNRSYILLHFTKYKECIEDIDRALNITKSDILRIKLLCRKMTCLKVLGENELKKVTWESIKTCFETMDVELKNNRVSKLVEKAKNDLVKNMPKVEKETKMSLPPSISIGTLKYDKNCGIHFIATCEIKPGEVIVSKKPYNNAVSPTNFYVYCSHCLLFSWANIPCDYCCISMYCSEKCKTEAWKKYHFFECSIMPHFKLNPSLHTHVTISIKTFIMGMNEAGSIIKLKEKLTKIDGLIDKNPKSYYEDGENINFASMYSLPGKFDVTSAVQHIKHCCVLLTFIIQTFDFFGENFKLMNGKDLAKDEDVLFVGTLLFKLIMISSLTSGRINKLFSDQCRNHGFDYKKCLEKYCCRGTCNAPFLAIVKEDCSPNAKSLLSPNGELTLYCLRPIKKNEEITISRKNGTYDVLPIKSRQMTMGRLCTCQACTEDWPTIDVQKQLFQPSIAEHQLFERLTLKYTSLLISCSFDSNWKPDYRTFSSLTEDVAEVLNICRPPRYMASFFINLLNVAFEQLYKADDIDL